jgi:hypothetical protein
MLSLEQKTAYEKIGSPTFNNNINTLDAITSKKAYRPCLWHELKCTQSKCYFQWRRKPQIWGGGRNKIKIYRNTLRVGLREYVLWSVIRLCHWYLGILPPQPKMYLLLIARLHQMLNFGIQVIHFCPTCLHIFIGQYSGGGQLNPQSVSRRDTGMLLWLICNNPCFAQRAILGFLSPS